MLALEFLARGRKALSPCGRGLGEGEISILSPEFSPEFLRKAGVRYEP